VGAVEVHDRVRRDTHEGATLGHLQLPSVDQHERLAHGSRELLESLTNSIPLQVTRRSTTPG